jgi:hypothetical protein
VENSTCQFSKHAKIIQKVKKAMNQEISLAATAAITDDLTRIQELCPAY